jgi:hypothetical protein
MKKSVHYVIVLSTLLVACKKRELPVVEEPGSPVFYVKAELDGVPLVLEAGVNNYFMKSSYYLNENNIYVCKAELKKDDCASNCGLGLSILINDYKFSNSSNVTLNIDSAITPNVYPFSAGSSAPLHYQGTFSPLNATTTTNYQWNFSDGAVINGMEVTKLFDMGKHYSVSLLTKDARGCSASHTNVFEIGNSCQTYITASKLSSSTFLFMANIDNNSLYRYFWDFGDGNISQEVSPSHTYSSLKGNTIKLKLVDSKNDTCISTYQLPAIGNCEANYKSSFTLVPNTKALSTSTILFTDQNGVVYSSNDLQQSAGNSFEVVSVENYKANEKGEQTKKVKIRFTCNVKNGTSTLRITNGEAVIALSYK